MSAALHIHSESTKFSRSSWSNRIPAAQRNRIANWFSEERDPDDRIAVLDQLIGQFVRFAPAAGASESDAEQFVQWLSERSEISPQQRDLLVCIYSRHAVEMLALQRRIQQARFEVLAAGRGNSSRLYVRNTMIHLNPAHVEAMLETDLLLEEGVPVPARVLFFQIGHEVRTVLVSDDELPVLRRLQRGPVRMAEIMAGANPDRREEILIFLERLLEYQLIALGG